LITENQASEAVDELGSIPYFPRGDVGAKASIMRALCAFVDRPERLAWLVDTAVNRMTKWDGVAGLRSLYCVRFRPADGIEGNTCTIQGFTPADCEAANALPPVDFKKLGESDRAALRLLK